MECVLSHYTLTNGVQFIEDKMIKKMSLREQNSRRVSGRFELLSVQVIRDKSTENVRSKSKENQFWFKLVWAIRVTEGSNYWKSTVICTDIYGIFQVV